MWQFLIYKLAQLLVLTLPLKAGYAIAAFLAKAQFCLVKKDRETVISNMKVVLNTDDRIELHIRAKEVFVNFAKYLVDFFRFGKLDKKFIEENIAIIGRENLDKGLKRGKGAIILTAHLGNYELGGAVTSLLGYKFNAVALNHKNKFVNSFFIGQRESVNVNVIPVGGALRKCYECLNRGEVLALLGDRDFSNHGIKMGFFGRTASIPTGPAMLSLRTGAAIVPAFFVRLPDDKFQLAFEEPLAYIPIGDLEEDLRALTEMCIKMIEDKIRQYSSQWFMFGRLWQ